MRIERQYDFGPARATSRCGLSASSNLQLKYLKMTAMQVGEKKIQKTQI